MNTHKVQSAQYQNDGYNKHDQNMIKTDTERREGKKR